MADHDSLTLAFLSGHPAEAARILERLNGLDAAALFARVPARAGAPVLTAMLPSAAARILVALEPDTALSLLAASGTQAVVTILRQIPESQRRTYVEGLPTTVAIASRLLLHYPDDSVGAWVDPDIVVLPPETTVTEAIARVATGDETLIEHVFSVDRDQHLLGSISLHQLLRVSGATRLANVTQYPQAVLNASETVRGVARRRGWRQSSAVPVMERSGRLIGVLRRGALDRALARWNQPVKSNNGEPVAVMLARGYWSAFSVLADAAVSCLPQPEPIVADDN